MANQSSLTEQFQQKHQTNSRELSDWLLGSTPTWVRTESRETGKCGKIPVYLDDRFSSILNKVELSLTASVGSDGPVANCSNFIYHQPRHCDGWIRKM